MKKVLALLMIALLIVSMTACSKKDGDDGSKETTTSKKTEANNEENSGGDAEEITLTVWESTNGPDEFIKQAGEAFTAKHPNISINFMNVELGDSSAQIALDGPAGIGPDLFAAPHDKLGELVSGGHIMPTVDAETLSGKVLGSTVKALTYDGTMYGYPVSAETYALFYNKALVSEADVPTTWEDMKTFVSDFSSGDQYGFMMDVANGYYTILFTTSADNRLFGPEGTDSANTNINSQASVNGMTFFQSLNEVIPIPAADLTTSICDEAFKSGKLAMYITGPWNIAPFEEAGIEFGVTSLPSLPGDDTPAASFSGTRAMFVSAYTDHSAEAALFGEFLVSEEMQQLRYEITGTLPSIEIEVDSPYAGGFLKQLDYAFPMPSIPAMSYYWDAMNAASSNIWDGSDVQSELDAANDALMQ